MVQSRAKTVTEYLSELPGERREVIETVRSAILEHLPDGYVETMGWGMISYEIPLERYPETYNGKPLVYAALAAQKKHYAVYLMGVYADPEVEQRLRDGFTKAGKRLDLGKSCVRFKKLDDIALGAVGSAVASTPVDDYIELYERTRRKE